MLSDISLNVRARALRRRALSFEKTSDVVGGLSGISRVFRVLLQSAVLGLGAYLTLLGHVTAGAIIAASIATSRALAPIELAISHWKGFVGARQAYGHRYPFAPADRLMTVLR